MARARHPVLDRVSAHAAAVRDAADQTVQKIIAQRALHDGQGSGHEPLFVLLGEDHSVIEQKIHAMLVLDALQRAEPATVIALEEPHDRLFLTLYNPVAGGMKKITPDYNKAAMARELDRAGTLALQMMLARVWHRNAHYTHEVFYNFLLRRAIPARFTDVSYNDSLRLSAADPSTAASINEYYGEDAAELYPVFAFEPAGIAIRNHHMARQGQSFARETGARIVVHLCGALHMAGDGEDIVPGDSLAAHYKRGGAAVVAIDGARTFYLNDADILAVHEKYTVHGLPQTTACYDAKRAKRVPGKHDIKHGSDERAYVDALMTASGMQDFLPVERNPRKLKKEYTARTRDAMASLRDYIMP